MSSLNRADSMSIGNYADPDRNNGLEGYNWQFIAEGDSWYSMTDTDLSNQNLLEHLYFTKRAKIVNAARPGDIAGVMFTRNDQFRTTLQQRWWVGILISASGNDLIDALHVTPRDPATGKYRLLDRRLLLTPEETGDSKVPADYVSGSGFDRLASYLLHWFGTLVEWRDVPMSQTRHRPIFLHDYSIPVPRPAGVLGRPNGWLHSALTNFGIPAEVHKGIVNIVFGKLRGFLMGLDSDSKSGYSLSEFHVFDSAAVRLEPAVSMQGSSGDWINEIHLTTAGAEKIGRALAMFIEDRFSRYAMPA